MHPNDADVNRGIPHGHNYDKNTWLSKEGIIHSNKNDPIGKLSKKDLKLWIFELKKRGNILSNVFNVINVLPGIMDDYETISKARACGKTIDQAYDEKFKNAGLWLNTPIGMVPNPAYKGEESPFNAILRKQDRIY